MPGSVCGWAGCLEPATVKGYCNYHYHQLNQRRLRSVAREGRGIGPAGKDGVIFRELSEPIPILRMDDPGNSIVYKMVKEGWLDIETLNKRSRAAVPVVMHLSREHVVDFIDWLLCGLEKYHV